jgi:esterase
MIAELEGLLSNMTCPTLVVRGGKSDILLPEDAERFANALPDGRWIEVKNAGHAVQGDNPGGLVGGLRGFFDAVIA